MKTNRYDDDDGGGGGGDNDVIDHNLSWLVTLRVLSF